MDPTDSSGDTSTWQTLASVLAGGLGGLVDAQNHQPVYVQTPAPQTAYGYAGVGQSTPVAASFGGINPVLLVLAVGATAFFAFKK